jgi:hypothetical protein
MKRIHALAAALLVAAAVAATASAATSATVKISVGDRYRGATLTFRQEPTVVLVPDTKVYYVRDRDCDLYRYGRFWYFVEDGYWYRSASWRGPFLHIRTATVPHSVVGVPPRYRRHWRHPAATAAVRGERRENRVERHVERRVERREDRRMDRAHERAEERQAARNSRNR